MECRTQAAVVGDHGGGTGTSPELDSLATAGAAPCAAARGEERNEAIQGTGQEIRDVEAERHAGAHESMEDGGNCSGEEVI